MRRAAAGRRVRDERAPSLQGLQSGANARGNSTGTIPGTNLPASGGAAGFGGQSMAGGVQVERKFEYKQTHQAQVPSSAYLTTPTNQALNQASWGSTASSVALISSPQASNRAYSEEEMDLLGGQRVQPGNEPRQRRVSKSSKRPEVLKSSSTSELKPLFLLNQYACAVEDALIEQVRRTQAQSLLLEAAGEERAAMNLMLTDPDVLADYVNDFFGPNGPYPTPTEREAYEIQQMQTRQQFAAEIEHQRVECTGTYCLSASYTGYACSDTTVSGCS